MDIKNYYSGEYRQQYQYKSFTPSAINHAWYFSDNDLQQLLSDADRTLGELSAFSQFIPNVNFFIQMHIAKEATHSTRIEGTRTNIEDALLELRDVEPEKRDDWEEVQNYIKAINQAIEQLQTLPLSIRLLKATHKTLMQGVRGESKQPGEFRTSQNWIGPSLKNAVFIPPHQDEVDSLMSDLEMFLHNETLKIPHLIKIAIAHYQFETIHPFLDGNGRIGRLMIPLYLAHYQLLNRPALYLSDYFEKNKTAYIENLMAVRQANNMKQWLIFFLQGVIETGRHSIQVFKSIIELKEKLEREVLPRFGTRRQQNAQLLMKNLYQSPVTNIKSVATLLSIQNNTATDLINDFVKWGVLKEITGQQRNRLFVFQAYIGAFD